MQILRTIDGKIHHLKELDFIERQLFELFKPEDFYNDLKGVLKDTLSGRKDYLTFQEMEKVDKWIKEYFYGKIPEANTWLVRAYVVGRLLEQSDQTAQIFRMPEVVDLPKSVIEAAKQYNLTKVEAKAMTQVIENAGVNITNTTADTIQKARSAITQSIQQHEGSAGVERRLRGMIEGDAGELNRDWRKVSITETNTAFNNAYLSNLKEGDYVRGISMPDCCPWCQDYIHNKIVKVRSSAPAEYQDKIWENEIWVGKNNIGRSTSKRKQLNKELGNSKGNLIDRDHHENSMFCVPAHPNCRCRTIKFNPKFEWLDDKGQLRLSVEDPEKHKEFIDNLNIEL